MRAVIHAVPGRGRFVCCATEVTPPEPCQSAWSAPRRPAPGGAIVEAWSSATTASGAVYARHRRADRRIMQQIEEALADARSVVNIGAGTGVYEPAGRRVVAAEPSKVMIAQRQANGAPVVRARSEERRVGEAHGLGVVADWIND